MSETTDTPDDRVPLDPELEENNLPELNIPSDSENDLSHFVEPEILSLEPI